MLSARSIPLLFVCLRFRRHNLAVRSFQHTKQQMGGSVQTYLAFSLRHPSDWSLARRRRGVVFRSIIAVVIHVHCPPRHAPLLPSGCHRSVRVLLQLPNKGRCPSTNGNPSKGTPLSRWLKRRKAVRWIEAEEEPTNVIDLQVTSLLFPLPFP